VTPKTDTHTPTQVVPLETPRPFSSLIRVDFGAATHRGLVREKNEDHYLVARVGRALESVQTNLPEGSVPDYFAEVGHAFAVADGMGGHASGEVASTTALLAAVRLVLDDVRWSLKINEAEARELMERMGRYVRQIHRTVTQQALADPRLRGMGTTLTVAYSVGADLFIVHVGDTRVYVFRKGKLHKLTTDHTVAQRLADLGVISQEEVTTHRMRHALTNVIGGFSEHPVQAEIQRVRLADGDRLLLCSDGLTDMVDDEAITGVLARGGSSDAMCAQLIDMALAGGGKDNVTVVLAGYSFPEGPVPGPKWVDELDK
jgi:protein phosphatase